MTLLKEGEQGQSHLKLAQKKIALQEIRDERE